MHQIRYFLAVARLLNFTRAAEECNVAQPSLSRAIKKLEDELGGELFRRERSRTHLSELGRNMLPFLRQSYESALAAIEQAGNYRKADYLPLRLGLSHTVGMKIIAPMLAELARAFPGLELHFRRGSAEEVLDALKSGDVELVVAVDVDPDWERFDCWPLFEEGFAITTSRRHVLARRRKLSLADIAGETIIARPYGESTPALAAALQARDIPLRQPHEAASDADVAALVESGLGLGLLPVSVSRSLTTSAVTLSDLEVTRWVKAYGVAGRQRSIAATGLVRLLRAADWSEVAH